MPKTSKEHLERVAKYNKAHTTTVLIRLNHGTDADLIEYLNASGNKQGTIKAALREHMKNRPANRKDGKHYEKDS